MTAGAAVVDSAAMMRRTHARGARTQVQGCAPALALALAALSACEAPPRQPPPPTQQGTAAPTVEGRWLGTFMTQGMTSGGRARWVIDSSGKVTGSLVDTVWQRAHGAGRTGALEGSCTGGIAMLTVTWSTGQVDRFEGAITSSAYGSMGCNASQRGSDGNAVHGGGITFDMHEAGVAAQPPFGTPTAESHPDFLQRFVGRWSVTFSASGGDAGTGAVTIARDGTVTGSIINDAFSDAGSGFPATTTALSGKVTADGSLSIGMGEGTAMSVLQGHGYFETPEMWVVNLAATPEALAQSGPAMTMSFSRH